MQGVSVITDLNGQPAVLTIDLRRLDPTDSPLVAALLGRLTADTGQPDALPVAYEMADSFEQERREFLEASGIRANRAYSNDEYDYTDADLIERNPNYRPK